MGRFWKIKENGIDVRSAASAVYKRYINEPHCEQICRYIN